jgi:hypothetical protein
MPELPCALTGCRGFALTFIDAMYICNEMTYIYHMDRALAGVCMHAHATLLYIADGSDEAKKLASAV